MSLFFLVLFCCGTERLRKQKQWLFVSRTTIWNYLKPGTLPSPFKKWLTKPITFAWEKRKSSCTNASIMAMIISDEPFMPLGLLRVHAQRPTLIWTCGLCAFVSGLGTFANEGVVLGYGAVEACFHTISIAAIGVFDTSGPGRQFCANFRQCCSICSNRGLECCWTFVDVFLATPTASIEHHCEQDKDSAERKFVGHCRSVNEDEGQSQQNIARCENKKGQAWTEMDKEEKVNQQKT